VRDGRLEERRSRGEYVCDKRISTIVVTHTPGRRVIGSACSERLPIGPPELALDPLFVLVFPLVAGAGVKEEPLVPVLLLAVEVLELEPDALTCFCCWA